MAGKGIIGLVWSGLVWSGLVWSGLVWSGLNNYARFSSVAVGNAHIGKECAVV